MAKTPSTQTTAGASPPTSERKTSVRKPFPHMVRRTLNGHTEAAVMCMASTESEAIAKVFGTFKACRATPDELSAALSQTLKQADASGTQNE